MRDNVAPLLSGIFQLAYVTRDLKKAASLLERRFALQPFSLHEISLPCTGVSEPCVARVAISWTAGRQFELIEPVEGAVDIYRRGLPAEGWAPAFHHVGLKVLGDEVDWRARCEDFRRREFPLALEGGLEGRVRFAYFDARATLGHHIEVIWLGAPFLTPQAAAA